MAITGSGQVGLSDLYDEFTGTHTGSQEIQLTDCMMFMDFHTYLTDDILCKVDRSSMNYSLESRMPFLDLDLFKYAMSLPINNTPKITIFA